MSVFRERYTVYGSKEEVTGDWRNSCNEELQDLYQSPDVTEVMKLRRMRWTARVPHVLSISSSLTRANVVRVVKKGTVYRFFIW
jgi:hypothetical protein